MTAIARATAFTAPRARQAERSDEAPETPEAPEAPGGFRAMLHDAARPRRSSAADADGKPDDATSPGSRATPVDGTVTTSGSTDDAQTIAAQQAAIAQAITLPGTPTATAPATPMTPPVADDKLGATPTANAAPAAAAPAHAREQGT